MAGSFVDREGESEIRLWRGNAFSVASRTLLFLFWLFFWAGADTANWRRRQSPSWPLLSAALAASHLRAWRGEAPWLLSGARTSPSVADVLEQPKFVCACFVVFPSGGLRVRVILFEISCCLFLLVSDTVHNF